MYTITNLEDTDCQKHRDSFSEQSVKNFIKNGENNKRKYLKIFRVMLFYSALKRLCKLDRQVYKDINYKDKLLAK